MRESPVSRNLIWIVLGLAVLAGLGAGAWYLLAPAAPATGVASTATSSPGFILTSHDRHLGNPKAKVVLIEYGAPRCPVCAAFNRDSFPALKAAYIDTGKIYYVFRVFPLRSDDGSAEKIARCLPEDKYFSFIDLLFRNQPLWDVEYGVTDVHGGLVRLGRIAGMSADQVDKCMDNPAEDKIINTVAADGGTKYSISGTPTFVLDGSPVFQGTLPNFTQFSATLDKELAAKH
jgi:protein-disulfide isomerase